MRKSDENLSTYAPPNPNVMNIPGTPFAFIRYILRRHRGIAFFAVFFTIVASALNQLTSYFFKLIVDASEQGDTHLVIWLALAFPIAVFFVQMLHRASGFLGANLTTATKRDTSNVLTEYLLGHSHTYFSNRFSGSLLSKITGVVSAIESIVTDVLWTHLTAFVAFIIAAIFIWRADVFSGVCFIMLLVMLIGVNHFFAKEKKKLAYRSSELGTKLRGTIVDILTNMSAVRQYVRGADEMSRVVRAADEWRNANWKSWTYSEKLLTANSAILGLFSVMMFYSLARRWQESSMSTGDFVFILALYAQITGALLFVGRAFNSTARSIGEMKEGLTEIIQSFDIVDLPEAEELSREGKKTITWEGVTFGYHEEDVFRDFNLKIKEGQRVGVVGSSGSGKSTFVSLLLRQHDLNQGTICIGEQDISRVTQDSLRSQIAVVPQEPMLFHRSIRENIAYGKLGATDEEIIEVAKKAQAHDFVTILPQGYDTLVGERGVKLSGGQKQRIAIARAMLKNAPILVLDEATSALDSESEVAIQKALHELMEGKTVIAIAHRLSTLREMDRIIVLENGKIVEDGSHAKLVKKKGQYAKLWEHQAGGFLQE